MISQHDARVDGKIEKLSYLKIKKIVGTVHFRNAKLA